MRITFQEQTSGVGALQIAAEQLSRAQREVTTGRRVNVPSDDPIAARTVVQEHSELASLDAYRRSADTAASRLSAADTALSGLIELYSQATATAAGGRGTTATPEAREAIAASIRGVRAGVMSQINAQFAGRPLFAGSVNEGAAYNGTAGAWTYQGNTDPLQIEVQRDRLVAVTFDGQSILQGSDVENVLNTLDALADAVAVGDQAAIKSGMDGVERAAARASRAQGRLGADERGTADAVLQLTSLRLASETRRSQAEDANMAEAIPKPPAADTAYRAVLAAVSREERLSLLDYLR